MLIDVSYFTAGPRQIYNATFGKGTPKENAVIEQYIAEYREEFLCRVLGDEVGTALQKYLDDLDCDPESEIDKDMDALCAKLRKPFADYVFFYILRDAGQTSTITGLVKLKGANQYVEPIVRQCQRGIGWPTASICLPSGLTMVSAPCRGFPLMSIFLNPLIDSIYEAKTEKAA